MEEKVDLSENGKNEVIELNIKGKKATIVADFSYLTKAIALLVDTTITAKKGTSEQKIDVKMNPIAAGDLLLFQCWHSGDEEIKTNARLRLLACKQLGEFVQSIADEDSEIEKKS